MSDAQKPLLHVAQIGFFEDPQRRPPLELLKSWTTLGDVAEAACRGGVRVSVIQAAAQAERLESHGVHYYFGPFGRGAAAPNRALGELLAELAPDVLHVHGLDFSQAVLALAQLVPGVPIILQDHASRPPRLWRRPLWRRSMAAAAAVAFCASEQAQPFARAGLLRAPTRVYEIRNIVGRSSGRQQGSVDGAGRCQRGHPRPAATAPLLLLRYGAALAAD
jgi:hypothetical protein